MVVWFVFGGGGRGKKEGDGRLTATRKFAPFAATSILQRVSWGIRVYWAELGLTRICARCARCVVPIGAILLNVNASCTNSDTRENAD